MKVFSDSQATEWQIDLNAATLRRVQALLGLNLTQPHEQDASGQTLGERLVRDTMLLVDVLWAVCKPQAEGLGINEEAFASRLGGGALRAAKSALIEDWSDFFQSLGQTEMAEALNKTLEMQTAIGAAALKQIERVGLAILAQADQAITAEGDKALAELTRTLSGESSTNSPGSSE